MDCAWVKEHLEGYLSGETSDGLSTQISEHLPSCDDCRAQAMQLTALTQRLRELPTRIVPQGNLAPGSRPVAVRPRRRRMLIAAVAVLATWAVFSGGLLASLRSENTKLQRAANEQAALPMEALVTVRTLLAGVRGEGATGLPAGLLSALASASGERAVNVHLTSVDAVQSLPGGALRLHLHVAVNYAGAAAPESKPLTVDLQRRQGGGWQVTRVSAR